MVCTFVAFLGLAWYGISASVSGDSRLLSVRKGILVLLPPPLYSHIEQFNVFEPLRDSGYDVNFGFIA